MTHGNADRPVAGARARRGGWRWAGQLAAGAAFALLLACASTRITLPPDANRLDPANAPTPFSAEQIRRAFPDGTWVRFATEGPEGPTGSMQLRFSHADAEGAIVETVLRDSAGKPAAQPRSRRSTWRELQSHASFLESEARITPSTFDSFRGRLDGWLYEVTHVEQGQVSVTRYSFARELPGPPVLLEETANGALVRKMTMVGRGAGK